uniref:LisH domain-containing protein n=2 Tax=Clytia hemisphaerica TaxID=252671 RepID=A0A7M5XEC9_9CNID
PGVRKQNRSKERKMIRGQEVSDTNDNKSASAMFQNNKANNDRNTKASTSSNSSTTSTPQTPEAIAKEKLAIYVYEYLQHQGATRAAQTFLSEIQWEKNIALGDSPGFLTNWWCVFWDLYSAAPERQEPNNHTHEAKAFHDLNSGTLPSPNYIPQPPGDMNNMTGMPGYYARPPMGGNNMNMLGAFMGGNRYNAGRTPNIRIPNQMGMGGQLPFSNMDPSRQQQVAGGNYQNMQANSMTSGMRPFNNGMGPVPPNYNRLPSMSNGSMMGGNPMGGPSMQMAPRGPWNNPPPPSPLTPGPTRTPILSSPQGDPTTNINNNSATPVSMSPFGMKPPDQNPQMNISGTPGGIIKTETNETLEDLPTSVGTGGADAEIQRIKESMKEEVKKFEVTENSHVPEYYNMH